MKNFILKQVKSSCEVKELIYKDNELINLIIKIGKVSIKVFEKGNKILIAGNGGSAADSQHIAGELVNKFAFDRPGLPAIALTTDTSVITAVGNDYGYDKIFAKQVEANGQKKDLFIGISTSGNTQNVIEALKVCKKKEIITVGLTGMTGGSMAGFCDYCIKVPSNETPRIQEAHILIGHIICSVVEEAIFGEGF